MKKEIALSLADALDSGDYIQGCGINRDEDDRFCIGGVLINLFAIAHPLIAAQETDPFSFLGHNDNLPKQVADWADVGQSLRFYKNAYYERYKIGNKLYDGLRQANDLGVPFHVLSAWLRENYEKV